MALRMTHSGRIINVSPPKRFNKESLQKIRKAKPNIQDIQRALSTKHLEIVEGVTVGL